MQLVGLMCVSTSVNSKLGPLQMLTSRNVISLWLNSDVNLIDGW